VDSRTLAEKISDAEKKANKARDLLNKKRALLNRKKASLKNLNDKNEELKTTIPGESRSARTHRLILIGAESHRLGIRNADVFLSFVKSLPNSIFDDALESAIEKVGSLKPESSQKDVA